MARKRFGRKKEAEPTTPQETVADDVITADEDILSADDIDNMSDKEFQEYLDELALGAESADEDTLSDDTPDDETPEPEGEELTPEPEPEETEGKEEKEEAAPFRTFATEDEYEAEIKKRIDSATKDKPESDKDSEKAVNRILRIAKKFYKDSENPLDEVANELEKQYAEAEDMDIDELRDKMSTEDDAEKWRAGEEQKANHEKARQDIIDKWNYEAEQLKFIDKDFDFAGALKNEKFKDALLNGKSVIEAYSLIKESEKEEKPAEDKKEQRESIDQNARQALKGTGESKFNPAKLSDKDFKAYIENIKNS
jgi:hypothetical protein